MTTRFKAIGLAGAALVFGLGTAVAQDPNEAAVDARQGQFSILALNIGVLGNMARGNTDYDAGMAQTAADNIVAVSTLAQDFHWPEGTDTGAIEGTRALPAIWEDPEGFAAAWTAFGEAAASLQTVAGDGLESLGPAVGAVGSACGDCHDNYRQSE